MNAMEKRALAVTRQNLSREPSGRESVSGHNATGGERKVVLNAISVVEGSKAK